ncbi:hypothetical protein HYT55_05775 [Candidatus Woesearchaeota archaeon]|nr:hypothetical protein [Candidatus Woesearchaeota archaeon]
MTTLHDSELKTAVAAVSADLQFIAEKLRAIDEKLETTPFLAFRKAKRELSKMIKQTQANIKLVYNVRAAD